MEVNIRASNPENIFTNVCIQHVSVILSDGFAINDANNININHNNDDNNYWNGNVKSKLPLNVSSTINNVFVLVIRFVKMEKIA